MPINEAFIRSIANAKSFARGQDYYDSEAVSDLEKRGDMLTALVEGSQYEPYQVTINFKGTEFVSADCDCPYDFDGYCKHVVAVLLAYLHEGGEITEKPPIETLLADLSCEKLLNLLTNILKQQPQLINWVEAQLVRPTPVALVAEQPYQRRTPINPAPFIQQVIALFPTLQRKGGRYYDDNDYYGAAGRIAAGMAGILEQITPFLEAGDGANALIILEAVIHSYMKHWVEYDDSEGELGLVFNDIGYCLAEAILQANLTVVEREKWQDNIQDWEAESSDYDIDGWGVALDAARQGWDYSPLQKVLAGEGLTFAEVSQDETDRNYNTEKLTEIRLRVLARQGRMDEYLRLAKAEGQSAAYVTMLVQSGRAQEAIDYPHLKLANDALSLAQALQQHHKTKEALLAAERGLSLHEPYKLAKWLVDMAEQERDIELALRAAIVAFKRSFTLVDYQRVKTLAGEQWGGLKAELLKALAKSNSYEKVKIYIAEWMVDEAITVVDNSPYMGYDVLPQLIEIATPTHPDWVIKICRKQADPIMDEGRSKYYGGAAEWLRRAKAAYLIANRQAEWRVYLEDLITKHQRKYSLRPLLEKLR